MSIFDLNISNYLYLNIFVSAGSGSVLGQLLLEYFKGRIKNRNLITKRKNLGASELGEKITEIISRRESRNWPWNQDEYDELVHIANRLYVLRKEDISKKLRTYIGDRAILGSLEGITKESTRLEREEFIRSIKEKAIVTENKLLEDAKALMG